MPINLLFRFFFSILLTWFFCNPLSAQQDTPPILHCASLQPDGTVQLSWTPPSPVDPSTVYTVYRDNGSGFQLINTVGPSSATGYFDGLINASNGSVCYYVSTNFLNQSPPSSTVCTIFLDVNALSQSSVASLSWNNPFSAGFSGLYVVERRIAAGAWENIASLTSGSQTYLDTLHGLCVAPNEPLFVVDYRIRLELAECASLSQVATENFQDLLGPQPPQVETVLINPLTGDAEIYWFPSLAPDLDKYVVQSIIQEPSGTVSINVGSVMQGMPTEYTYEQASSTNSSNLVVIAFDSCGNDNSYLGIFTTMFLKSIYTTCGQTTTLTWNAYNGWTQGVNKYQIYAQVDGAPFEVIAETSGNQVSIEIDVAPNSEYCFYIEAISNGTQRASTSNEACITTTYPEVINYAYLSGVSATADNTLEISLYQDVEGVGTTYELWRSRANLPFQKIMTLIQTTDPIQTYLDIDADASREVYTYKWRVFDGCEQELFETNTGRNILLNTGAGSESAVNALDWTDYTNWEAGVANYEVFRSLGSEGPFLPFAVISAQTLAFTDDVDDFIEDEGFFCYKIVATEVENSFGFSSTVESNVDCLSLPPLMWVPNAIVINGFNPIFKPVAGFIDFDSYAMEVRSKWGELIFETTNIDEGWDGTYRGGAVREDQYQYVISYRDGAGKPFIKQGGVFVLHESN